MDIKKQISLKLKERSGHATGMENLLNAAQAEERAMTEEEQKAFDTAEGMIKTLDIEIENLERVEKAMGTQKAIPVTPVTPAPTAQITAKSNQDPKLFLARMAHSLYVTGGSRQEAAIYAKSIGDDEVGAVLRVPVQVINRATSDMGTSTTAGWAAELTTIQQANAAFIDMLRAASVVARFPGRQMSFDGDSLIKIPKKTTGAKGSWVGEGKPIAVGKLGFTDVELTPKKAAIIVPSTAELLAKSSPSALMLIQQDIIDGTAENVDTKFVSADAMVSGISPAGLLNGISGIASAGSTLAQIDTDLKAITGALLAANVPMNTPVWLMNPLTVNSLAHVREGTGAKAFPEIANGMLGSYPIIASTTVATTSVILTDAAQIIIASDYAPIISISEDATLVMEDDQSAVLDVASEVLAPTEANRIQSMYQQDAVAIRLKLAIDWGRRHDVAVAHLTGVAW